MTRKPNPYRRATPTPTPPAIRACRARVNLDATLRATLRDTMLRDTAQVPYAPAPGSDALWDSRRPA